MTIQTQMKLVTDLDQDIIDQLHSDCAHYAAAHNRWAATAQDPALTSAARTFARREQFRYGKAYHATQTRLGSYGHNLAVDILDDDARTRILDTEMRRHINGKSRAGAIRACINALTVSSSLSETGYTLHEMVASHKRVTTPTDTNTN